MFDKEQLKELIQHEILSISDEDIRSALIKCLLEPSREDKWKLEVCDATITVKGWIVAELGYYIVLYTDGFDQTRMWGVNPAPAPVLDNARWFPSLQEAFLDAQK